MLARIVQSLTAALIFGSAVFACSTAVGTVDDTPTRVNSALGIFVLGILVLTTHIFLFVFRKIKEKHANGWVFGITVGLSLPIIPAVFFLMVMFAGTACGFGTIELAAGFLIFESFGLIAQLLSRKFLRDHKGISLRD